MDAECDEFSDPPFARKLPADEAQHPPALGIRLGSCEPRSILFHNEADFFVAAVFFFLRLAVRMICDYLRRIGQRVAVLTDVQQLFKGVHNYPSRLGDLPKCGV